ncbi:MAG TPA: DUF3443 family protein [Steroidobacteraceae bacterium]|nr:DUF3443 family protein [Steroidobacteraceae bacterium]
MRKLICIGLVQVLLVLGGCGGGGGSGALTSGGGSSGSGSGNGGGSTSGSNVVAMAVNAGPGTGEDVDTPFITVTVCAPGSTTNCAQISNIEVDTGSYGLRILSSALSSSVIGSLTQENASNSQPLVECTQFVDGISWGPVMLADVQIGGESASNVPIQVIGDSSFPDSGIPSGCLTNGTPEDTVAEFGANGIIGVGPFAQDCGSGCVLSNSQYAQDPSYYACPSGGTSPNDCVATAPALEQQVTNPVVGFTSTGDDNGVIVQLPSVPDPDGAATESGYLVFGIGTQSNNSLGNATVLTGDGYGDISTMYDGTTLPYSYLDTGSNAYYFDASGSSSIPDCASSGGGSGGSGFSSSWLCPTSEQTINLTNEGQNGTSSNVSIKIYNATTLFNEDNATFTAFDDLGADTGSQSSLCTNYYQINGDCYFDLGLPFFFGRNVYVAIAGYNTPGGEGPYFAY